MALEPVTVVEIDVDRCVNTWGVGVCTAALGLGVPRKCYNTFATCNAKAAFSSAPMTLRFIEPRGNISAGETLFPALTSVSAFSSTVNISGSDAKLGALGRRATVAVEMQDFTYSDFLTDPYRDQRLSGAAQTDEAGYDPSARGTFFAKLKARWPHYAGRALRVLECDLAGAVLVVERARHFVITDMTGPGSDGVFRIEGKDVLDLADNERALYPAPSRGVLASDLEQVATELTLTPAGVGDEYAAAGRVVIGSEIISFTRAGDVMTLTARGLAGTEAKSHKAGDTVQTALHLDGVRLDDFIEAALVDGAGVPAAFIPKAKWAAEVSRWLPSVLLTTHICSPAGVAGLVGDLANIGVSIWWDDVAQEIGLRGPRPAEEGVTELSEFAHIKRLEVEDRNEDRLTQVYFHTVQRDPTKSATSTDNYSRALLAVDLEAQSGFAYGDTRVRRIPCRWFNDGADSVVSSLARRMLFRFNTAPKRVRVMLDYKDIDLNLMDVVSLSSESLTDETGKPQSALYQVIGRSYPEPGFDLELTLQAFEYSGRYGVAMPNDTPNYSASSEAQKANGMYAVDPVTLRFPDGSAPYLAS